jgi:hypothetical protein
MQLVLKVEQLEERHIEPHVRLSRTEFGECAPVSQASHLRWKYLENPQGPSTGIHIYHGTELVGRALALSRSFFHDGNFYRAAHVVDLLVHSDFRGMAALHLMMKGLKELKGFDFYLILAPNPAGAAVWEKLWKMEVCFELDASIVPLRPFGILHSLKKMLNPITVSVLDWPWRVLLGASCRVPAALASVELENAWPAASELDKLFCDGSKGRTLGNRTAEYLLWRYRNSPVFRYEPLVIRRRGDLAGFLITRKTTFEGMDCSFIVDAFASPRHPGIVRNASLFTIWRASKDDTQVVMLIGNTGLKPLSELIQVPFFIIPPRYLPRRLTVFAEWIGEPKFPFHREQFHLALGDSDVV